MEFQKYTIAINELSQALGVPRHSILKHRSKLIAHPLLDGLPAPASTRPRLTWWVVDIDDWVASRRTFSRTPVTHTIKRPQRGRPPMVAPGGGE